MAHFYDQENEGVYSVRFEQDGVDFELSEDNFFANLHRLEPLKDRVAVQDPSDEGWWAWWRYDQGSAIFDEMVQAAVMVGTVVLTGTATVGLNEVFDETHHLTEGDYDGLLGEADAA
jgi:hypothetical protein